ncbi:MAG TPA: hypothetical protein EYP49_13230 [Anaerolineae bacterium]|nr:hypothetical protein [Anaerolineae bacterium]
MYHKAKASGVIEWILQGETHDERQRRIQHFLENEGYLLPEPPRDVDRSEEGDVHLVYGTEHTVSYAVIDCEGRKVYHYRERELDHIIIQRIDKGDEWAVEYISHIPPILKRGRIVTVEVDKIIYQSRKRYLHPEMGFYVPFRVIVKQTEAGKWYVDTFYPLY